MDLSRIIEIDFLRCLKALLKNLKWIICTMLVFLAAGVLTAVYYVDAENVYDAKSSVYSISYGSYANSSEGVQVIKTYSDIVKSLRVAERAELLLGDGNLDKFAIYDMIEIEEPELNASGYPIDDSSIINIHAQSTSPDDAIRVANAVANAFVMEVSSITMESSVQVLDEAYTCEITYNALKEQGICVALFVAAGILLSCAIIVLKEIFSTRIVSIQQGTLYGELDIIGVIPVRGK